MSRRKNELTYSELENIQGAVVNHQYTFDELMELHKDDCVIRNLRPHTIKFYQNELRAFKGTLNGLGINPNSATTNSAIIKRVIRDMQEAGIKATTINTRIRALKAFYSFCYRNGYIKSNPTKDIHSLKTRKPMIETFSVEQIESLLKACDLRTFIGVRDYTILMLFIDTGIRANELIGIRVEDVNLKEGTILIRNTKTYFERTVPIQKKMKDQLKKWLSIRGAAEDKELFITLDGTALSKRQVQTRVSIYGKKANITNVRCSPHTLRHTFAKLCVMNGANVFQLQQILGHTTLDMTKTYVNLFSKDVQKGHNKFSPLNNI